MHLHQNKNTIVQHLGLISYQNAWDYQTEIFDAIVAKKMAMQTQENLIAPENYVLFCEHPHVYTLGKSGSESHLLIDETFRTEKKIEYFKINRGGDITYHGFGQLVGYPILDLDNFFTDIHKYLRYLEEAIIRTLADYGILASRLEKFTGVWIDADIPEKARKICAMGVRTSRWVTMHGFALNVNTDLSFFDFIVPCGISDKAVTSMEKELGQKIDMQEVANQVLKHLADLFEMKLI